MKEDQESSPTVPRDPMDAGMQAAFEPPPRSESVLPELRVRTGERLDLHLHSADDSSGAPVKITEEVKALRDPAGRYQMLGEIGRGGLGIVYKGRDQDLGRDVAMKILKDEYATRPDVLARFVEEAQIGGQLQHPGIVPVYELGLQAGERPYLAMKLVKGETLAAQLAKRTEPMQERRRLLGVFEQVCQTVAYAHARRVVHRDLKPANVMIGAFGEVQVVDWGFAKVLQTGAADEVAAGKPDVERSVIETVRTRGDSGSHSVVGSMMGTPAYMPPEQALGDVERVDERSDVFALGAILCEILTGDAPYREEEGDLVRQAAKAELGPAHGRLETCGADEALVSLSKECLSPAQRARPASAAEVAERVSAYLTSVEERARQAEVRAAEARLKHRLTLMSAGAGVLVLALVAGGWIWIDGQARARRIEATQRVATATSAASGAHGRAQSAGLDMGLWSTAVASAEQLVELAGGDDVDTRSRIAAEALLATVQSESSAAQAESVRRERDATMLGALGAARIPADEDVRDKGGTRELHRLDAAYAAAFAKYLGDVSLFERTDAEALADLRRGDIEVELAGSLDDWGLARDALQGKDDAPDLSGTARIRAIASQLDAADPWRSELRALLPNAAHESEKLLELANHADLAASTAVGCRVLGQALWNSGEREEAIAVLQRGQELHPRDFDLCFQLALRLDALDPPRQREAVETYRIAHAIRPEHDEVIHRQLLDLYTLGEHAEEERLARILIAHTPSNSHWPFHLGLALDAEGRRDEAIASVRRAIEVDPKDHRAYSQLGRLLAARGDLAEASASLRTATTLAPKEASYPEEVGRMLMDHGDLDEAVVWFRKSIELDPGLVAGHGNLGIALSRQGKLDEALACFRKVIALDPHQAHAHCRLGETLVAMGRRDEAIAAYREQIELDPKEAEAFYNLGNALTDQAGKALTDPGKAGEAIDCYRRALALDPKLARAWCNLANVLTTQGKDDEAIECYRKAIEQDPKLANAYFCLGITLGERGDLEQEIALERRAIELDPREAKFHQHLGDVLVARGRPDEAIPCYRSVIELDPKFVRAQYGLGVALQATNRHDEAIASFRKAIELDPQNPGIPCDLGTSLVAQDRLDEALASFRRAIELNANQPIAFIGLGELLWRQGHPVEALGELEHAVKLAPGLAWARFNLGVRLLDTGDPERALTELRVAEELYTKDSSPAGRQWLETTRGLIAEAEPQVVRRASSSDVLTGRRAVSSEEWNDAVQLGYTQKRYREVLALTESTLRDAPELVVGRYGAFVPACVAARLAASAEAEITPDERVRLRGLSRAWLGREVERWRADVERDGPDAGVGREMLKHVQSDPDLASVRGAAIDALPEGERDAWRALWKRIEEGAAK